jgi:integrase
MALKVRVTALFRRFYGLRRIQKMSGYPEKKWDKMWVHFQHSVETLPNVIYLFYGSNMKLTDAKIRAAQTRAKSYKLTDGGGLVLLVHANGSKYWRFNYRFGEKSRSLSVGTYPQVTLAEARAQREEAKSLLRENLDPSAQRRQDKLLAQYRDRNSFELIAAEWRECNRARWTPRHEDRTWSRLCNHVFPQMGKRSVGDIEPLEVLAVIRKIEGLGFTDTSRTVLGLIRSVFAYAIATGRAERNPALQLAGTLIPHRVKHYPTIPFSEVGDFLRALDTVETTQQNKIAVKVLMHTALRTGELRHGRWQDLDLENQMWRVPSEFTKTRKEHLVPLSKQVCGFFKELDTFTGQSEWLFPNQQVRVQPVMSENTINHLIRRMGYHGRLVGHGFRSLFSTTANEHGFNSDAIERQLAHTERNQVRAAYNRAEYLRERRDMMQWWSDYLELKAQGRS